MERKMHTDLVVAVDKDTADYRRIEPNSLWPYIQEQIERCFGPLAVVVKGKLAYNGYLRECYVKDFAKHEDEKVLLEKFDRLINEKDLNFYSDVKAWVDQNRKYFENVVFSYDDFKPDKWQDLHYPRMICGRKGSGKTTLLLFTKARIEERTNIKCIYVYLANPAPHLNDSWCTVRNAIIHQLDDLTLELREKANISESEMVLKRHKRLWQLVDAFPDLSDSTETINLKRRARDEQLKELSKSKYETEFVPYFLDTIKFLKEVANIELILMIDDIDRLQSEEAAKNICDRARGLAMELGNIPIMVSVREETLAKLSDVSSFATRISIIPPSFSKVLQRRVEVFLKDFSFKDDAQMQMAGYNVDDIKTFVKIVTESILQKETYSNLVAFHYDLDILLDIVRCLVRSPFMQPEYVLNLHKKGEKILWHVILDTMQRFQYKNFYDENSFLINVFDNDESPATMSNALVRIRVLQVIRYRFKGLNRPLPLSEIFTDMEQLGYVRKAVVSALTAFAKQRIIVTWRMRNAFTEDLRQILPQPVIVYYLDSLLYSYRYLQNVLPVTHIDFHLPIDIIDIEKSFVSEKLKVMDTLLLKFVEFVKKCEEHEITHIKDMDLFNEITREETLSKVINAHLDHEIQYMKK